MPTHIIRVRDLRLRELPSLWPTWLTINDDGVVVGAERSRSDLIGWTVVQLRAWLDRSACELVEVA